MMKTTLLEKLTQHSRRVLITKRSLPVLAFLIASLIIVWPLFNQTKDKFTLAVADPSKGGAHVEMENVRFFGLNNKKMPMTFKTPQVKEEKNNPELARMIKPVATYQLDVGDVLVMNSPYAFVNQKKQTVFFEDRIFGKTDSGYDIQTSQVLCDFDQGTADSNSPVRVTGPAGKLNAQGVWMADKGNLILFKKKSTAVIQNKKSPIHLYATDGIQIDQKEQTITAITNAKATQEQITIKADKLILHYTNNKKERIDKIEAIGHVVADNKKQTIQGEKGLYNPKTNIIQMNQNVVLNQNGNFMKGDQATLNLATGKSDLTSSGRITGQILPNQIKGE